MTIKKKEQEKMILLAKEGKQITKIRDEDFPEYDYWNIYVTVYGAGEHSARGIKWMISKRLNDLVSTTKGDERNKIINEIRDLILYIYKNYRINQEKIDKLRKIIG